MQPPDIDHDKMLRQLARIPKSQRTFWEQKMLELAKEYRRVEEETAHGCPARRVA